MLQAIKHFRIFAVVILAGTLSGCGSSSPAEEESSPTGALAERFSDQKAKPAPAPEAPAVKETASPAPSAVAVKETAAAAPEKPVSAQPVPATSVEKNIESAVTNPPPVNVNVQVNLPDHSGINTVGEREDGANLSVMLPSPGGHASRPTKDFDRGREKFRRGPGMWRLFAQLSEGERRELQELQRQDPERYRTVIRQKLDELYAKDNARREELRTLVRTYQEVVDSEQKAELKRRMTLLVRSDFRRRLSENRLQFEDLRARSIRLEKELDKRAANAEAIIAHQVEELLSGKIPLDEPPMRRHPDAPPQVRRGGRLSPPPEPPAPVVIETKQGK